MECDRDSEGLILIYRVGRLLEGFFIILWNAFREISFITRGSFRKIIRERVVE